MPAASNSLITAENEVFTVGNQVRFHPIIGAKHDGEVYTVTAVGEFGTEPAVMLDKKRGWITTRAITKMKQGYLIR